MPTLPICLNLYSVLNLDFCIVFVCSFFYVRGKRSRTPLYSIQKTHNLLILLFRGFNLYRETFRTWKSSSANCSEITPLHCNTVVDLYLEKTLAYNCNRARPSKEMQQRRVKGIDNQTSSSSNRQTGHLHKHYSCWASCPVGRETVTYMGIYS